MMKDSGRIAQLDGLRGIAILAVIGIHAHALAGGRAGVDIFFALSGYLITNILVREYTRTGSIDLGNFYMRRAARLLPALGVFLAVIAAWSQFQSLFVLPNTQAISAALFYFANWQITWLAPSSAHLGPLTHTWSLSIEEQFYLAWPLLLGAGLKLRWSRNKLFGMTCMAVVALILWRFWLYYRGATADRLYFATDTHSDGLLIGCALALIPANFEARLKKLAPLLWPLAAIVLLWLAISPFRRTAVSWLGLSLAASAAAALILSIPTSASLRKLLSQPVLVWLGLRSYSLYLWHFALLWGDGFFSFLPLPQLLTRIVEIAMSVLLAEASYRWIEQPALRLNNPRPAYRPAAGATLD